MSKPCRWGGPLIAGGCCPSVPEIAPLRIAHWSRLASTLFAIDEWQSCPGENSSG